MTVELELEAMPEAVPCADCGTTKGTIEGRREKYYARIVGKCRRCYRKHYSGQKKDKKSRKEAMLERYRERLKTPLGRVIINALRRERRLKKMVEFVTKQIEERERNENAVRKSRGSDQAGDRVQDGGAENLQELQAL